MRRLRPAHVLALALALAGGACRSEPTVVVVSASLGATAAPAPIVQLRARLTNSGVAAVEDFPRVATSVPLAMPASFALVLGAARRGTLELDIQALAADTRAIARGCGSVAIVAGGRADIEVRLYVLDAGGRVPDEAHCRDDGVTPDGGADAEAGMDAAADRVDAAGIDRGVDERSDGGRDASAADATPEAPPEAPPIPPEVIAWEPTPAAAGATVTAIGFARYFMAVGFSDGEIFVSGGDRTRPTWSRVDQVAIQLGGSGPPWAVTALALSDSVQPAVWGGYASGGTNVPSVYRSQLGASPGWAFFPSGPYDDVLSISKVTIGEAFPDRLVVVTARDTYATPNSGASWTTYPVVPGFASGGVIALAPGVGPNDVPRLWLGDIYGGLYFTDGDTTQVPDGGAITWTRVSAPLPPRGIAGIGVNPLRPTEIWLSFTSLIDNNIWFSDDRGATWNNRHTPRLPAQPAQQLIATFGAVMPYPVGSFALLNARHPTGATTTYYTLDQGRSWWPRGVVSR